MTKPTIVIAGASGFVGRALAPLISDRFRVVGLSRTPREAEEGFDELRSCDLFSLKQAEAALEGADYAVYLVHSMMPSAKLTQGSFADLDLVCADNFARAAAQHGVKQIVYLGGLCPSSGQLSKHLESRLEVEEVLGSHDVPVTTLRAGLILGATGSSFQILVRLVKRLPFMICPAWTNTRTQAVALTDVTELLQFAIAQPECFGRTYDIGAPDQVTYRSMMKLVAELLGKKRFFAPVRLMSPGLSRLWVTLITGAPRALVSPLVQSLRHEMIAKDDELARLAGVQMQTTRGALEHALAECKTTTDAPHAFGGTAKSDHRYVRSVQRSRLPDRCTAERAAGQYLLWLPRALPGLIRVEPGPDRRFRFVLGSTGLVLLELGHSADRSSSDRQLFYVTGGALARPQNRQARFELRQVLDGQTLLTVVHDYEPRLPWFIYVCTQALMHKWLMKQFSAYLSSRACRVMISTLDGPLTTQDQEVPQ